MSEPIKLRGIGDIIAAIPGLLGFTPTESIVLIVLKDHQIEEALRTSIADAVSASSAINSALRSADADGAMLVVIAEDGRAAAFSAARHLVETLRLAVEITAVVHVPRMAEGVEWTDLVTGEAGKLADPRTTEVALQAALSGRIAGASREELEARYEVGAPVSLDRARAGVVAAGGMDEFTRATMTAVIRAARPGQRGISEALTARLALILAAPTWHREAVWMLGPVLGYLQAHDVLADAARHMEPTARAQALTYAGSFAYLARDGVSAGLAFSACLHVMETEGICRPALLRTFSTLLHNNISPNEVPVESAVTEALADSVAKLGIDLEALKHTGQ